MVVGTFLFSFGLSLLVGGGKFDLISLWFDAICEFFLCGFDGTLVVLVQIDFLSFFLSSILSCPQPNIFSLLPKSIPLLHSPYLPSHPSSPISKHKN